MQIDESMLGSNFDLDGNEADDYLRTMADALTSRGLRDYAKHVSSEYIQSAARNC